MVCKWYPIHFFFRKEGLAMDEYIIVGCDLSDRSMMLKWAHNRHAPRKRSFSYDEDGRQAMIAFLLEQARQAGGAKVVFVYEAGPHGFALHDRLRAVGIDTYVVAPTRLKSSAKGRKQKTDEKDAQRLFEEARGYVLAGNELPCVWVPSARVRADRLVVRAHHEMRVDQTRVRTRVRMFLKPLDVRAPQEVGGAWTRKHRAWLRGLTQAPSPLHESERVVLASLLRQWESCQAEIDTLTQGIVARAASPFYAPMVKELVAMTGVGVVSAMVFITEMGGELRRFDNRREVGAYVGVVPASHETGQRDDCKGHITRQGSSRLRGMLCQVTWARIRHDAHERAVYERLLSRNRKKKGIALVACMRRTLIRMWHAACRGLSGPGPDVTLRGGKRTFVLSDEGRPYEAAG